MENLEKILAECDHLLKNCDKLDKELAALKDGVDFLINEYKTNKRYFREKSGKVTIEDVIKTAFEFGWSSRGNFDYNNNK